MHESNRLNYVVHPCHGRCEQKSHKHARNERPRQWKLIDDDGGFKAILLWFIIQIGSKKNDALRIGITYYYMDKGKKQKLMKTFSFIFFLRNGTDVITRYLLNFIECVWLFFCLFFCVCVCVCMQRVSCYRARRQKSKTFESKRMTLNDDLKPNICNSHMIL